MKFKTVYSASAAGWHAYYVERFNKFEHPDAAMLAMFYLFCAYRDGEIT